MIEQDVVVTTKHGGMPSFLVAPEGQERHTALMNHLTNAMVTDDISGMIGFLDAQDRVAAGPIGCVGCCMRGRYITSVSAQFPRG